MLETIDQNFIKNILKDRGLNKGEIEEFLNPVYDENKAGAYDARKMKDMDKAIKRIWKAIDEKEKICIYSDYDADGVPGAVILYSFFKKIKYQDNVIVKIPHRHKDGFGLHKHLIDEIEEEGVKLIVTIDLGTSNVDEVKHANGKGIDVIITDHHEPHEVLPESCAILNSKQKDCNYVDKNLCGSGVIFKLTHLLIEEARKRKYNIAPGFEKWLLDMTGLATISDMVPSFLTHALASLKAL
jgi:single-stranded-DNA-specific exonuclease